MDCEEAARLVHEYLDCVISEETRLKLQAHLNSCEKCFGKFEFEGTLRNVVRKCSESELPPGLCDRISGMLEKET